MKQPYFIAGFVFVLALFVLPGLAQTGDESPPEFYFTRLVYEQGSGPARTPTLDFQCADLAAGEGGTQFGGGWGTDFPASDCKFMWGVERLTNIRVYDKSPHLVTALDPKLFGYPYLYIVSPHRMYLVAEEAEQLREYLLRGGFLHVDGNSLRIGDLDLVAHLHDFEMIRVFHIKLDDISLGALQGNGLFSGIYIGDSGDNRDLLGYYAAGFSTFRRARQNLARGGA